MIGIKLVIIIEIIVYLLLLVIAINKQKFITYTQFFVFAWILYNAIAPLSLDAKNTTEIHLYYCYAVAIALPVFAIVSILFPYRVESNIFLYLSLATWSRLVNRCKLNSVYRRETFLNLLNTIYVGYLVGLNLTISGYTFGSYGSKEVGLETATFLVSFATYGALFVSTITLFSRLSIPKYPITLALILSIHFILQGNRNIALPFLFLIGFRFYLWSFFSPSRFMNSKIFRLLLLMLIPITFLFFQVWSFLRNFPPELIISKLLQPEASQFLLPQTGELSTPMNTFLIYLANQQSSAYLNYPFLDSYFIFPLQKIFGRFLDMTSTGPAIIFSQLHATGTEGLGFSPMLETHLNFGSLLWILLLPIYLYTVSFMHKFYLLIFSKSAVFFPFGLYLTINLQRIDFATVVVFFFVFCVASGVTLIFTRLFASFFLILSNP